MGAFGNYKFGQLENSAKTDKKENIKRPSLVEKIIQH
jgi:hypothetical protein